MCEIFEQRSDLLQHLFKFNPRKCNSAGAFSGYVHRNKSKCNIVLPLDAEIVRVFEKTLIGGYSCINTRLAFDTEIFLKDVESERVLFHTGKGNEVRQFSSKIIKMDENNQYGFAMTKPLPYGCIKKNKVLPTLEELEQILNNVTLDDKLGHLFVVDIVFDKVNEKTLLFNELYPPIFEKNKKMDPVDTRTKNVRTKDVHKRTFIFGSNWKHGKTSQSERLMNVPIRYVLKTSFSRPSFFFLPHSLRAKTVKISQSGFGKAC